MSNATDAATAVALCAAIAVGPRSSLAINHPPRINTPAAATMQRKPQETMAEEMKLPMAVSPITSGVNGFSLIGAFGLRLCPKSYNRHWRSARITSGVMVVARIANRRSHLLSGDIRQSTTRAAIPIGNSAVSNAGASTGGIPM